MGEAIERFVGMVESHGEAICARGTKFSMLCPAHDDTKPSLDFEDKGGAVVLVCRAGCSQDAVLGALEAKYGLTPQMLWDDYSGNGRGPLSKPRVADTRAPRSSTGMAIECTYDYPDASGALIFQVVRYRLTDGGKTFRQRRPDPQGGPADWINNLDGVEVVPYRLPEVIAAVAAGDPVYIVEGEKDADTLAERDYAATTAPMGAGKWPKGWGEKYFKDAYIVVVADLDVPGYRHALDVHDDVAPYAKTFSIAYPGTGGEKHDATDAILAAEKVHPAGTEAATTGAFGWPEIDRLRKDAGSADVAPPEPDSDTSSRPSLLRLSDVSQRAVEWFWDLRIPAGKITLLDGDPDNLKSTIALDLGARSTTGRPMPDGTPGVEGNVLLLSAEDDAADTIAPRFTAAGGDLSRCVILNSFPDAEGRPRPPELPTDVDAIAEIIRAEGIKFMVVDPLTAFLAADVKINTDHHVRRALLPLKQMAEDTGAAILVIRHLTKDRKNGSAIHRGGGSIGIVGAARSAMLVAVDPEDEDKRVLAQVKANLAPTGSTPSLGYRAVEVRVGVGTVGKIEWLGLHTATANELIAEPTEAKGARAAAVEFMKEALANGPMRSTDLEQSAKDAGIKASTLKRARKDLGVISNKRFDKGWEVSLPAADHN